MLFDRDLRYRAVGGRGFDVIPMEPEALIGKTPAEVWPPTAARMLEDHFRRALGGESSTVRIPYGDWLYECWVTPHFDGDEVTGGLIMTLEVSDSVRIEMEHDLVLRAVENLPVGLSIAKVHASGARPLIFVNDGFQTMTGYSRAEVVGRDCRFLQGPQTDRKTVERIRRALDTGEEVQVALLNYRKNGEAFWNRLSIFPVRSGSDAPTHFIGIQEDVTERRRLNRQLEQSERLRVVGQIAGGVAHDIRNVLTGVGGLLEIVLARTELAEDTRQDLAEARGLLDRGSSVTSRLLAFASAEAFDSQHIAVNQALVDRARFFRHVLKEDIQIAVEECEEEAWILGDPGQLDQILLNLVKNAEDAMPAGGRLYLRVRCGEEPPDRPDVDGGAKDADRWVRVVVEDSGQGMESDVLDQALEPFFTTKRDDGGTGLGLSSVFGAVKKMGGVMVIDSRPGEGTRVELAFPMAEPPDERVDPEVVVVDGNPRVATILVVEDEDAVRKICIRVLESAGHDVHSACDATEALAWLSQHHETVDLLLTDAVIPHGSGVQIAEALLELRPEVPILLMSGYTEEKLDGIRSSGNGQGKTAAFLGKPFTVQELLDEVGRLLGAALEADAEHPAT